MITTKYVREHIDEIRASMEKRKSDYPIDELLELDEKWRAKKTELQELQTQRNKSSLEISEMKKRNESAEKAIAKVSEIKERIKGMETDIEKLDERIEHLLMNMPNTLHSSVPYGASDEDNVEIRRWGEPKKGIGKSHEEILAGMGLIDIERAAKVAGARFYYLKGDIALLEHALISFALDELAAKGYTAISPPLMLKKEYYKGATALGDFEEQLYKVTDTKEAQEMKDYEHIEDELFMISTSEHPMAAMHSGEVFSAKELPIKYAGISPCFRREAGSHGKDTKGIFRVHQFYKVEQFIFCRQEDSWKYYDELLANSEGLMQKLGLPYHVIDICTGDIGTVAAKKNDIEVYMPSQGRYREVVSCSNCTDWQSLRLDIKYDEGDERKYVHTLNSTAIAVQRVIVGIVENYARPDGTIEVPKALVPYMHKDAIGKPGSA
ncbi:MAG: serine--tRNA ligase [Candidatus Marsarchaeota archaeon]|nr:serine--tRNA ligase [Candidatus Marsarchaeota archaeon]